MLSTPMLDNGPVQMTLGTSMGASVRAAVCRKHTAVSCLEVGCDWLDECQADVYTLVT